MLGTQFTFYDVQIGAANTTGPHSQKNMPGRGLRIGDVGDLERALRN